MINKKIVFVFTILLLLGSFFVSAGCYPPDDCSLTELYPEDYSFRSGLIKTTTTLDAEGNVLSKDNKIWNSRYPFMDPIENQGKYNERYYGNVGFKAQIIRNPLKWGDNSDTGKISYTLAVLPFLEATESTSYDLENPFIEYMTTSSSNQIDRYGNIVESNNNGYTRLGFGSSFSLAGYRSYYVKNPLNKDGQESLLVNSFSTNLQRTQPVFINDAYNKDNTKTETNYLYETSPIEEYGYDLFVDDEWVYSAPPMGLNHAYMGMTGLPVKNVVIGKYSKPLSTSEIKYVFLPSEYENCGMGEEDLHKVDWNCLGYAIPNGENTLCVRPTKKQLTNLGSVGLGFYGLSYLEDGTTFDEGRTLKSTTDLVYDDCGNVQQIDLKTYYKHPFEEPYGENYNPDLDLLKKYSKTVSLEYDSETKSVPRSVTVVASTPITVESQYTDSSYPTLISTSTNERGIQTNYKYDVLGRIKKMIAPGDSELSPTAEYSYSICPGLSGGEFICIFEKVKLDESRNVESWHFYDGMGRWFQTQTRENDLYMIVVGTKYDVLGRAVNEYRPSREDVTYFGSAVGLGGVDFEGNLITYVSYEYDGLGRVTTITDSADGSTTEKDYSVLGTNDLTQIAVTDANLKTRTFTTDARGGLIGSELPILDENEI